MTEEVNKELTSDETNSTLENQLNETLNEDKSDVQESHPSREISEEEINWKKKREQDRKDKEDALRREKEKDDQIRAYKEALEQVVNSNNGSALTKQEQEQVISDLADEDIPTGGEIKNFLNKAVPDILSSILEKREEEQKKKRYEEESKQIPQKLETEYKDFKTIVQQENLDYLDYHYPEVAATLSELPHSFQKWSRVYKTIKKLVPNTKESDMRRIESNSNKPQSMTTATAQKSAEAGYGRSLTEAQKAENFKRMRELARGV